MGVFVVFGEAEGSGVKSADLRPPVGRPLATSPSPLTSASSPHTFMSRAAAASLTPTREALPPSQSTFAPQEEHRCTHASSSSWSAYSVEGPRSLWPVSRAARGSPPRARSAPCVYQSFPSTRHGAPTVPLPCQRPRADFIRAYGAESRHWMPAFASMTVKPSFTRKRESRSHTGNCKSL
jgi:hypothetical protein